MFKQLDTLLTPNEITQLLQIVDKAEFVDGRISNPHSKAKNNLHINDADAYRTSSKILQDALIRHEDFQNFAFPQKIAPPLITRYSTGMHYGLHPDSARIGLHDGPLRSDLSCTIFLNDPKNYEGGALKILLGDAELRFKGAAGSAIVYPSSTLHEVEKVESGERIVGISFIESRIAEAPKREMMYELNEVAALEGHNMSYANFTRIQSVQNNLMRLWGND